MTTKVSIAIKEVSEFGDDFLKYMPESEVGVKWNNKKVYIVYKSMFYNKRYKLKKRLPARVNNPLVASQRPNLYGQWILSVMHWKVAANSEF